MTDVGRPLEKPFIEILPAESPVPEAEPVPAGVPVPAGPGDEGETE